MPPVEVIAGKPIIKRSVEWDSYAGRLVAIESVDVQSRVSGYLQSHHFQEGELVEQGQLLFVIDPRPFEASLHQAQAALAESEAHFHQAGAALREAEANRRQVVAQAELASAQLQRARPLLPSGAISQDEFDVLASELQQAEANLFAADATIEAARAGITAAEASIATAKAGVETAELDVSYTKIIAPVTGRIGARLVTEGNYVSGGAGDASKLTSIVSIDPIQCEFFANERALMKYIRLAKEKQQGTTKIGQPPVYMALVDEQGYPNKGVLDFVDNQIDRNTGSIRARAVFENTDGLLRPGMFTRLQLPGSIEYDVVLIPESAISTDQSSVFVFKLDDENQLVPQPVRLGAKRHGLQVVREGLTADDTIVLRGLQRCRPGMKVVPTIETIEEVNDGLPDRIEPTSDNPQSAASAGEGVIR